MISAVEIGPHPQSLVQQNDPHARATLTGVDVRRLARRVQAVSALSLLV
jgi:hypothetical protein